MSKVYLKSTLLDGSQRHSFWVRDNYDDPQPSLWSEKAKKPYSWPLPRGDQPGEWLEDLHQGPLIPHRSGFNLAPLHCALQFVSTENYLAEADGEIAEVQDCVVARRVRLLKKLDVTPRNWRILGCLYAMTALDILHQVDYVRPYLEHNLEAITQAFCRVASEEHNTQFQQLPSNGERPILIDEALQILNPQIWRFAHDIPASGIYEGPATASLRGTEALRIALQLMATPDTKLDHAMQAKIIASYTRQAAFALADDYVEHRGRVSPPHGLARIAGVALIDNNIPDSFPRAVRHALFKRQNDAFLRIAGLPA